MRLKPIFPPPTTVTYWNVLSKFYYKYNMEKLLVIVDLQCFCDSIFTNDTLIRVNYPLTMWKGRFLSITF